MFTTTEIIKKYNLLAKKSFGQNFLVHNELLDKIVKCAGNLEKSEILEIGTGPAGLTTAILRAKPKVLITIDMDERCIEIANNEIKPFFNNLQIIQGDALNINEDSLFKNKFKIIANLPYNIGTTLLFKWLENYIDKIESMTLLLQKEVVERIVAKKNTKDYGRLSVMCQYLCDVKKEFDIQPSAFLPAPKVVSSVINLVPKQNIDKNIVSEMSKIVQVAFNQRRKILCNNLKQLIPNVKEIFQQLNINENARAEDLSVEDFYNLCTSTLNTNKNY